MNKNRIILSLLSIALATNSTGLARYKSKPLNEITKTSKNKKNKTPLKNETEYVSFEYKALKSSDCKKYFNSKNLIKKGYRPIQIALTNHSNNNFAISLNNFNLSLTSAADVAYNMHRDGMKRAIGFTVGSLFIPILIIPAIVQGFGANSYNEQMDRDFSSKALELMVIAPYQTINGVIFVNSYQPVKNFTFSITNVSTNQIVTLSCQQPNVTIN